MTGADLLAEAVTELYAADPEEFVGRRGDLVAQARAAGQQAAAKQIAALRKPTRSAWVVNHLARSAPRAVSELSTLGQELRDAQRSGDGVTIRALSQRRHQIVEDLVRQALAASGQRSPPAALRAEVTATLSAAVADPQVAARLSSGTLERSVHREGFGPAGVLTLVTSQPDVSEQGAGRRGAGAAAVSSAERERRPDAGAEAERRGPDAGAEAERRRRLDALADAEREAAEADQAADTASAAEQEQEEAVRLLEEQLAEARMRLSDTRASARRLRAGQRRARQALDRLRR